jgi:serine/threonine protein kinase
VWEAMVKLGQHGIDFRVSPSVCLFVCQLYLIRFFRFFFLPFLLFLFCLSFYSYIFLIFSVTFFTMALIVCTFSNSTCCASYPHLSSHHLFSLLYFLFLVASKVAIKTYDKIKLKDPSHWKRVHSEIKIMEELSHPRIARMYEVVETPKRMHLIMECLDGSNLCTYVKAKKRLSEEESSRIFFQILQGVDYLHFLGVTHRDIKLENVLFVDVNDSNDVKLIDFGFSTICQTGKKLKIFCGTPSCKILLITFFCIF